MFQLKNEWIASGKTVHPYEPRSRGPYSCDEAGFGTAAFGLGEPQLDLQPVPGEELGPGPRAHVDPHLGCGAHVLEVHVDMTRHIDDLGDAADGVCRLQARPDRPVAT